MLRRCMTLLLLGLLSACAVVPTGPHVMVLPNVGKPFDQFQVDDVVCQHYAQQQLGITPAEASTQSTVQSAALGTILGAAAGAAIGAAAGNAGDLPPTRPTTSLRARPHAPIVIGIAARRP